MSKKKNYVGTWVYNRGQNNKHCNLFKLKSTEFR